MAPGSPPPARVLLADDQPDVLLALRLLLKGEGFQTEAVTSPSEILRAAAANRYDLILMDLNYTRDTTSGAEGLDLLTQLKSFPDPPPAVVMTAWSSIDLAVEAMRRGAVDFVTKPWDNARLVSTLHKNISLRQGSSGRDELAIAKKVQGKLFPQVMPSLKTLEYAGMCVEAGSVGGDYYDFLNLSRGRLGLVLADVCGKGMAAALLMANLQATLRSHCQSAPEDWAAVMHSVNTLFYESTAPEHFATAFIADYNDDLRTLQYINCGHNPPVVLRADGTLERLNPTALVVGAFRRFTCRTAQTRLGAGDWVVMFSDGIVEAQSEYSGMYGEERLVEVVRRNAGGTVQGMLGAVRESLDGFASPAGRDDWTLLAARGM
ncbi:MAG: SpoIIE family protein phosphatase [Bryobacterales bacterium]|nr:SpoIIE family protein phosphatase [Bryobacterales bacterium]